MQIAPSPAIVLAVLADFLFTFAKDFDSGAIDHHMHWFLSAQSGQFNLLGGTSSQRRIIRHRQVQVQQFKDRAEKTYSLTQRQVIDLLQSGHRQNCGLVVVFEAAGLAAADLICSRPKSHLR
jgi:hypothetical protein